MTGLVERLRSSAAAFRAHNVYTQDGDPVRLTVQADEADEAADAITRLRGYAAHDECAINDWLPRGDVPCPACTCGLDALLADIEGKG